MLDRDASAGEVAASLAEGDPADVALAIDELDGLDPTVIARALEAVDDDREAEIIGKLGPETLQAIDAELPPDRFAALVRELPPRDAAAVVIEAPRELAQAAVRRLAHDRQARDVNARLRYGEETAGGLMTTAFVRLRADMTVRKALDRVRRTDPRVDLPNDCYVVEPGTRAGERVETLLGAVSIRALVMAEPHTLVGNLMAPDVVSIQASASRQEAASLIAKHQFAVLPVVDEVGALVGVIPNDDVLRDVVPRLNRLYAHAVGADAEQMEKLSPPQAALRRVPWLLGTMAIELGSGFVIAHYDDVLRQVILLASFMPIISAVSGNVGLQAAAITVRALDTGHVTVANRWVAVRKELATTFLMALVCGAALGAIGVVSSGRAPFGIVIGIALTAAMLTAGVMGSVIPMVSKRLGFDPATTAGPFETAFQDVIGFAVFLSLASMLLQWLS
jgi:magnesium transporter